LSGQHWYQISFITDSTRINACAFIATLHSGGVDMRFARLMAGAALVAIVSPVVASETITYTYDAQGRLIKTETTGTVNGGNSTGTAYDTAHNRYFYASALSGAALPPPPPPPTGGGGGTNNPPVANADSAGTIKLCQIKNVVVTTNDTDADGPPPLTVTGAAAVSSGLSVGVVDANTISIETNQSTPVGALTVNYTVADGLNASATGTVSGTVSSTSLCGLRATPPPDPGNPGTPTDPNGTTGG
jgi:large repetitive protein